MTDLEFLTVDDLIELSIALMGDPPPIRDLGLLSSAAARPMASAFGQDAYSGIWEKSAALFQSLVKNHPLVDGNKRLAWLASATFLEVNGVSVVGVSNDAVYEFVYRAAEGEFSLSELSGQLRLLVKG